jgi:large subunit ribosomal protein L24
MVKRHKKQQQGAAHAGIIEKEMAMPLARVMLVCKSCNKPVRVGFIARADGKHRVCRSCGQDID